MEILVKNLEVFTKTIYSFHNNLLRPTGPIFLNSLRNNIFSILPQ